MIKDKKLIEKIETALQTMRPFLEADGGDMELVGVTDNYVAKVKFLGSCSSCNMSAMTLKAGIEEAVRKAVPEITAVEAVNETVNIED